MKTIAGIVTYNPDLIRLLDNIGMIFEQVDKVVLVDNDSSNYSSIKNIVKKYPNVLCIKNRNNMGIAYALNQIMKYAIVNEYDWALTLDQDSVCLPDIIKRYRQWLDKTDVINIGIVTCDNIDRNFGGRGNIYSENFVAEEVQECITSGSFVNVKAYQRSDGFDDRMFMGYVDMDFCYNLQRHGYRIMRLNFVGFIHEMGTRTRIVELMGRNEIVGNMTPVRHYYASRNLMYYFKKYPEYHTMKEAYFIEIRKELLILKYEDKKLKKLIMRWKGLKDSLILPVNSKIVKTNDVRFSRKNVCKKMGKK